VDGYKQRVSEMLDWVILTPSHSSFGVLRLSLSISEL
jgi:hypothetical protein